MKCSGAQFLSSSLLGQIAVAVTEQAMIKGSNPPMNFCSTMARELSEPNLASILTMHSWQLLAPSNCFCLVPFEL